MATVRRLALASLIVMLGFVASRLLGLVRNVVILNQFGAGRDYEIFLAAIAVPDLVFQVLAGGAVGSAFIPVFNGYFARGNEREAWRLTSSVMTLAALVTAPVALLVGLLAEPTVDRLLVPGWDAASKQQTAALMRVMLVSPVIFSVSCFLTSVLNSFHRFGWAALAPVTYNLAIIAAALMARPLNLGIEALSYGVNAGALFHLLVQVPACLAQGFRFRVMVDFQLAGVREVGRLMAPRMLGLAVVQLNQLVNIILASFLVVGSIGFLNVAWLLTMSPLVLAMSVSTAVFPSLASESALERRTEVRRLFLLAFGMIVFLTLPAAVGLIALGTPLIALLYERGQFGREATQAISFALSFYALGLLGHATVEITDRVFYAFHDTWTPVQVAVGAIATNLVLSVLLMQTPLNYGGLALANAVAASAEGLALVWLLSRRLRREDGSGLDLAHLASRLGLILIAALVMGLAVALVDRSIAALLPAEQALGPLLRLAPGLLVGAVTYLSLSYAFRLEEVDSLLRLVRRRF